MVRKVRTAQGNAPVNRRAHRCLVKQETVRQTVPQKITASLLHRCLHHWYMMCKEVRVKTQGKSLRSGMVTYRKGKPYMLKCHVSYGWRRPGELPAYYLPQADAVTGRQKEVLSN